MVVKTDFEGTKNVPSTEISLHTLSQIPVYDFRLLILYCYNQLIVELFLVQKSVISTCLIYMLLTPHSLLLTFLVFLLTFYVYFLSLCFFMRREKGTLQCVLGRWTLSVRVQFLTWLSFLGLHLKVRAERSTPITDRCRVAIPNGAWNKNERR